MGKKQERLNKLVTILQKEPTFSIKKLAENFEVSEMTIRRDLACLEESALLSTKPYINPLALSGSFAWDFTSSDNTPFLQIGKAAASLLKDNDIIIADSGLAASYMCSVIPANLHITILCYDFNTLSAIYNRPNITTIFAGGYYHTSSNTFESPEGLNLIQRHRASKVFLTADGLHPTLGATCSHSYLAALKRAAIDSAASKILLADSSVFDQIHSDFFLAVPDIDILITDKMPAEKWRTVFHQHTVQILAANQNN